MQDYLSLQDGEYFCLPTTSLLDDLQRIKNQLSTQRQKVLLTSANKAAPVAPPADRAATSSSSAGGPVSNTVANLVDIQVSG